MTTTTAPAIPLDQAQAQRMHIARYLTWNLDHKVIGIQYMFTAFCFFLIGGVLAMLIRVNLLSPEGALFIDKTTFNAVFSMHGTIMIFLFIIPMFAGMGNYL